MMMGIVIGASVQCNIDHDQFGKCLQKNTEIR
jgi:hypothetical protein